MTGQPGQQRHEKPSKTRKRRKRQQPLTGTRSLRNTREHTNGKSTESDSSPPGLLSTLELGPLTDQRNHERAQEPVTLDAEWQQTTSNSRKNFFFRRPLSPSRTPKQRKKQRQQETISHRNQHMEESALDTSGLATHDTIPALPSLLQHSPTNHWKRAQHKNPECASRNCVIATEPARLRAGGADERIVQGTIRKELGQPPRTGSLTNGSHPTAQHHQNPWATRDCLWDLTHLTKNFEEFLGHGDTSSGSKGAQDDTLTTPTLGREIRLARD